MDDFSVFGSSFENCFHLSLVLERCKENFGVELKKMSFHDEKGIVLRHIISDNGIEVDKAKVDLISTFRRLVQRRRLDLS